MIEIAPQPDGAIWVRCLDCAWHSFALPAPLGGGIEQAERFGAEHKCPASKFLTAAES